MSALVAEGRTDAESHARLFMSGRAGTHVAALTRSPTQFTERAGVRLAGIR